MAISQFTEFNLPRNAYAAFDAVSMKQLLTNRIKASGLFPDVDFEGSNISGLTDILAYLYHTLLFYLNQTATETQFSQVELYENMNKLVSLLGYKPFGHQTAMVEADYTVSGLDIGAYTVPRFSYTYVNGVPYSTSKDVTLNVTLNVTVSGNSTTFASADLLKQGIFKEYPLHTAIGEPFEQFTLAVISNKTQSPKYIDSNNIFVFVKDANNHIWYEWTEVSNLYLASPKDRVFEKRFNENGQYEIKFGNGIAGRELLTGDTVAVYYLQSDGIAGEVAANALNEKPLTLMTSIQWQSVFNDVKNENLNYADGVVLKQIKLNNPQKSTTYTVPETTNAIRSNVPSVFSTQNRTATPKDYDSVVMSNYSNILTDARSISNRQYTSEFLKYFYDIGLEKPNNDARVLLNQVTFTDACDFNNVYIFAVPKIGAIKNGTTPSSLVMTQKQAIIDTLNNIKVINQNPVVCDPIYQAFSFGLNDSGEEPYTDIKDETILRITRSTDYTISKDLIRSKVADLITSFFAQENNKLGQLLNVAQLNISILNTPGVAKLETVRNNLSVPKLNLIMWNPFYSEAVPVITSQNIQLKVFEFPFFYDVSRITSKIEVV